MNLSCIKSLDKNAILKIYFLISQQKPMACCGLSNMLKLMGEKILKFLLSFFAYLDLVTHELDTVLFYPKIVTATCRSPCGKKS